MGPSCLEGGGKKKGGLAGKGKDAGSYENSPKRIFREKKGGILGGKDEPEREVVLGSVAFRLTWGDGKKRIKKKKKICFEHRNEERAIQGGGKRSEANNGKRGKSPFNPKWRKTI